MLAGPVATREVWGQRRRVQLAKRRSPPPSSDNASALVELETVESAMNAVCAERQRDPLGSIPIDEMQARPSLPSVHPLAVAGARRAEQLLPMAKELAIDALRQLARQYRIAPARINGATARIRAVTEISPDVDLRDNASVLLSDPHTINFGTIFLVGLQSDESMISVLAHELTHIGDGRDDLLHSLFRQIGQRAAQLTGLNIYGHRPEELTCDLVGASAARAYIARTPNTEPVTRRLARTVEHNCVVQDDTDDAHLSPRSTMRAVLALDGVLAHGLVTANDFLPPRRTAVTLPPH